VAQAGRASGPMVNVALRGESASRLRALAAKEELTLAKLLVRMMEGVALERRANRGPTSSSHQQGNSV